MSYTRRWFHRRLKEVPSNPSAIAPQNLPMKSAFPSEGIAVLFRWICRFGRKVFAILSDRIVICSERIAISVDRIAVLSGKIYGLRRHFVPRPTPTASPRLSLRGHRPKQSITHPSHFFREIRGQKASNSQHLDFNYPIL